MMPLHRNGDALGAIAIAAAWSHLSPQAYCRSACTRPSRRARTAYSAVGSVPVPSFRGSTVPDAPATAPLRNLASAMAPTRSFPTSNLSFGRRACGAGVDAEALSNMESSAVDAGTTLLAPTCLTLQFSTSSTQVGFWSAAAAASTDEGAGERGGQVGVDESGAPCGGAGWV